MKPRTELDEELRKLLGSSNVYYQPPETLKIHYPCIVYKCTNIHMRHADNKPYMATNTYEVIVISKDPDFPLFTELPFHFQYCRPSHFYAADNLYHRLFTIYY